MHNIFELVMAVEVSVAPIIYFSVGSLQNSIALFAFLGGEFSRKYWAHEEGERCPLFLVFSEAFSFPNGPVLLPAES